MSPFKAVLLLSLLSLHSTFGYRPVVIFHGIFASSSNMDDLTDMIKKAHPGTQVTNVDGYDDLVSLDTMWNQVKGVYSKIKSIIESTEDGIIMICYSQGGLICRAILESYSHNVHTFISLSSPQAGQFGDTVYLKDFFPNFTKKEIYRVFYTETGQDLSIANYWNDPFQQDLYYQKCNFLPLLNNATSKDYKTNFLNLEQLVLIGGPDDGVITPWQSSHFGFYEEKSDTKIIPFTSQTYYKEDYFGLKTLHTKGKVKVYEVPGVRHVNWHGNQTVFDNCILPWLV